MKSFHHTFILLALLTFAFAAWAGETSSGPTAMISGVAGVPGVTMRGLPGAPTTDENGCYTVRVPRGWSGTVIPTKKGYTFDPPRRTYNEVQKGLQTEDYEPAVMTYVISGNVGLPGVSMQGLPGAPLTDENGNYAAQVSYGWADIVTPVKEGYRFDPPSLRYDPITGDCVSNDYKARILTFTISGDVSAPSVTLEGLPRTLISDAAGRYSVHVPYGWAGTVVPKKPGHEFNPPYRTYEPVKRNLDGQDYRASVRTFSISGNVGLDGVILQGLPGRVVSDAGGRYAVQLPYGWSGTVRPVKQGCEFAPVSKQYVKLTADQTNENYAVRGLAVSPPVSAGAHRAEVLVIPTSEVDPTMVAETREDMQVMLHILREMLSEPRTILGILYDYGDIFGGSDRGTQAFYLEGYGALFVMKVDFPFAFPTAKEPEDKPEERGDPVWQRARERLRSPGARRAYGAAPDDEMSFEQFKADLIKTLKHAANIRHIDPNESVILTVVGQDAGLQGPSRRSGSDPYGMDDYYGADDILGGRRPRGAARRVPGRDMRGNVKRDALGNVVYESRPAAAPMTVLTVGARKADIDAFAAGKIDVEQFRQRVNVVTY